MARNTDDQERFLSILEQTPFINYACKKVGISRATIYRWMKGDYKFKTRVDEALVKGRENSVDNVEAVLLNKALKGDLGAIKFYLPHNSSKYRAKEVTSKPTEESRNPFLNRDGSVSMSKQTAELIDEESKKEDERKRRAMGWDT